MKITHNQIITYYSVFVFEHPDVHNRAVDFVSGDV